MHFKIKSHFRNMHFDIICDGCRVYESTTQHILECASLVEDNQIVTYIPSYRDLYDDDAEEQVYIARIVQDNLKRIPEIV